MKKRILSSPNLTAEDDEESCVLTNTEQQQPRPLQRRSGSASTRCTVLSVRNDDIAESDYSSDKKLDRTHLPLHRSDSNETEISEHSFRPSSPKSIAKSPSKMLQLITGASGIYGAYLYYGYVQEDLFRYRSAAGIGFSFVWSLQVLESLVTICVGAWGRKYVGGRDNLPLAPFLKSGASQLAAKALMSLSLAAGLSFPVVVLAKSAKIVPVMLGQFLLGGSSYTSRDYIFAALIVCGTSLLSLGKRADDTGSDTFSGVALILLSLTADGFTGGLQKKLKRVTASHQPTAFDFLFYSHLSQLALAVIVCIVTGELISAPAYLLQNPTVWWYVLASCLCSATGQCFIFYVISCFDPLVCTTVTTTRKMMSVVLSISFKGHELTGQGCLGLALAVSALLVEVEGKLSKFRKQQLQNPKKLAPGLPKESSDNL